VTFGFFFFFFFFFGGGVSSNDIGFFCFRILVHLSKYYLQSGVSLGNITTSNTKFIHISHLCNTKRGEE